MKRKLKLIFGLTLLMVVGFVIWFIWTIRSEKEPQFFPFNEPQGEYSIVKGLDINVFMIKYKGPNAFSGINQDSDGSISVIVGKTKYDLNQYLGKKVFITEGDFVSSSQQCVVNSCRNIAGPYVVVNIEEMEEVQEAKPSQEVRVLQANPDREYTARSYYYAKDLGVRFKITDELIKQELTSGYKELSIDESEPVTKWLVLSTKFLSDATKDCSIQNGALGELWRGEGKYQESEGGMLIKQFSSFHIAYTNGGYNCSWRSNSVVQEAHARAWTDLENSITSVEELKTR